MKAMLASSVIVVVLVSCCSVEVAESCFQSQMCPADSLEAHRQLLKSLILSALRQTSDAEGTQSPPITIISL